MAAKSLANRERSNEFLKLGDELVVAAKREVGIDPIFDRGEMVLFGAASCLIVAERDELRCIRWISVERSD